MRLDNDILLYLKKIASEKKIGYQTLINTVPFFGSLLELQSYIGFQGHAYCLCVCQLAFRFRDFPI